MTAVAAVGFAGSVLGIIGFFQDQFAQPEPQGATIVVQAANLDPNGGSSPGGQVNWITGYDVNNVQRGQLFEGDGGLDVISDGGALRVTLPLGDTPPQIEFLDISAADDAVCIAYVAVTQFIDIDRANGMWNGDLAVGCSVEGETPYWYNSNVVAGESNGGEWRPYCAWLDGNHDFHPYGALKFNVVALSADQAPTTFESGQTCFTQKFQEFSAPMPDPLRKREISNSTAPVSGRDYPRKAWMEKKLIQAGADPKHNATFMCNHPMSYGPDFIGSDGYFCDMGTREVTPVCSAHPVEGCLHVDGTALKKRSYVAKREVHTDFKTYESKTEW